MRLEVSLRSRAIASVVLVGCLSMVAAATSRAETGVNAATALCETISAAATSGPARIDVEDRASVASFYIARDCRPFWLDEAGLTRAGDRLASALAEAGAWGLDASQFALPALAPAAGAQWTGREAAAVDLALTGAALRYARHARGGRITDPTAQLSTYLDRRPELPVGADVLTELTSSATPDEVLTSYHPMHEQFVRLKALLERVRRDEQVQAETRIARRGAMLKPGVRNADVRALKARFAINSAAGEEDLYTSELEAAVKAFQRTSGLRGDGLVGNATRRALAEGEASFDAASIVANMEMWRWMPQDLGGKHIFVNIPAFTLTLVDGGDTLVSERVIVGEKETQTPIFSMAMQTVVLRPEWYLPDSIKLTKILSGRSLESQGYVIEKRGKRVDSSRIDWAKANLSAYKIYQPSGGDNALGDVKFLFPNKHSVYMHDTPSKSLFNAPVRLFSHGCVRVRNPLTLAKVVLDGDKGEGALDVARLVRKGPHQNAVALTNEIPVHIGYFTIWIDADGQVAPMPDYYGHEKRVEQALAGQWAKIDKGKDHLAAVDTSRLKEVRQLPKVTTFATIEGESGLKIVSPMGVTNVFAGGYSGRRRERNTVGDMISRSLGGGF